MSQLLGGRRDKPLASWLPRLSLPQWIATFSLAAIIAALPSLWTLPGLVVLIASLIVVIKPEGAIYLLTMSIPFGYLAEIESEEFAVTPTEVIVGLMALGWLLRILARRKFIIPFTPLLIPLLGMLAVVALSIDRVASPGLSVKETLKWAELVLVYLFIVTEMEALKHARTLLVMLLLGAIVEAIVGSVQFFFNLGPDFYSIGRFMRAYGTFEQPNPYAGYLGMLIPLAIGLLLAKPGGKLQRYTLFALALALVAVGMSLSRGAWVGIALAVAVMMVFWSHHSRIILAAAAVASAPLGAMAFMNVLPAEVTDRLATALDYFRFVDVSQEVVTPQNYAVLERVAHWQAAINMIVANPLFGVGAGNYPAVYDTYSVRGWNEALGHAHNFYLNIAAETGFIGLAVYLSIFVIAFLHISRWLSRGSQELLWRGILAGVLGSLVASCVHNMFDSLFVHGMSIQLGMILALGQLSVTALARSTARSRPDS